MLTHNWGYLSSSNAMSKFLNFPMNWEVWIVKCWNVCIYGMEPGVTIDQKLHYCGGEVEGWEFVMVNHRKEKIKFSGVDQMDSMNWLLLLSLPQAQDLTSRKCTFTYLGTRKYLHGFLFIKLQNIWIKNLIFSKYKASSRCFMWTAKVSIYKPLLWQMEYIEYIRLKQKFNGIEKNDPG